MTGDDVQALLGASDPEERRRAAACIPDLPLGRRSEALLQALADSDWRVRKEATHAAMSLAPAEDVLGALLSVLGPGDNVGQRNAAVESLGGFGQSAVAALSERIDELDADGRKLAAEALARAGGVRALRVLSRLLSDVDPNVRAAAIESVSIAGAADVDLAGTLLLGTLGAAEPFEALAGLEGINRLGVTVPWEVLRARIDDSVLERAALDAVGRGQHIEAAPGLVRRLDETRAGVRAIALAALAAFVERQGEARDAAKMALATLQEGARRWIIQLVRDDRAPIDERKNALLVLGATGTTEAADVAILSLGDDRIAEEAEAALSMLGPAAVLALAARARTGAAHERVSCVQLLGLLADESTRAIARQAILDAAQDASEEVVRAALVALSTIGDERSMGLAARWLSPTAPSQVRHAAAVALGACAERYPDAARSLARSAHPDNPDAAIAAVVIASVSDNVMDTKQDDVDFLAIAASNEDPLVRRLAVDALGRMHTPSAVSAVSFALSDEAPEVQLAAARALGQMRDADGRAVGVRHLLEVVTESEDDALSVAAMEALGDAGDPEALDTLREVMQHGPPRRAVVAAEAVGCIEAPGRMDALLEAFGGVEPEVVKAAMRAVAADPEPRVDDHLTRMLRHEAWDVRRLAADLLGQRGSDVGKAALRDRLAIEGEPLVREAIKRSLAEAEGVSGIRRSVVPSSFGGSDE